MTTQKTFKRRIRARAAKTGESYTSARAQILRKADAASPAAEPDSMELSGVSDKAMRQATGRTIAEWLPILDEWGARERRHAEIARWLVTEHGVPGWWAQSVTVAYERARGMRAKYQTASGFVASASRTVNAPIDRVLFAATDDDLRSRWLPDTGVSLRASTPGKSARFDWTDPPSRVVFGMTGKGMGKTLVGVAHEKLPDGDAVQSMKALWRERLGVLKRLLEG
ncbi:MAG: DUF4287 domain-containing protein [Chloroflexota bacterium]|nr:DUF4287 domain-containing protein [Chloroflexota bacterium]